MGIGTSKMRKHVEGGHWVGCAGVVVVVAKEKERTLGDTSHTSKTAPTQRPPPAHLKREYHANSHCVQISTSTTCPRVTERYIYLTFEQR